MKKEKGKNKRNNDKYYRIANNSTTESDSFLIWSVKTISIDGYFYKPENIEIRF